MILDIIAFLIVIAFLVAYGYFFWPLIPIIVAGILIAGIMVWAVGRVVKSWRKW